MTSALGRYRQVIQALETRPIMPDRPPSLQTTQAALARLSLPIDPKRVIIVAGTNGKGSVCASLEALLRSAGMTVGLYTSPHLVETTERIRINGEDISQTLFCDAYDAIASLEDSSSLTHFEFVTLMAAWVFFSGVKTVPPDFVILEVGMGGTWDATNAIPHHWCIITSLSIDHDNLLGRTLPEIAANKFGVIQTGAEVIHTPLPDSVQSLKRQVQENTGSRWTEAPEVSVEVRAGNDGTPQFTARTPWGEAALSLPGKRGAENAATALAALEKLGFPPARHLHALSRVNWPGRMQQVKVPAARCPVYFSGDHNAQGVATLVELLTHYPRKRLLILAGVGKDKDLAGVLDPLFTIEDAEIFLTETPFKGRSLADYGPYLDRACGSWKSPEEAFREVIAHAEPGDLVLVTGSLYLVGHLLGKVRNTLRNPPT